MPPRPRNARAGRRTAPARRAPPRARSARLPVAPPVPAYVPPEASAHAICRRCGRIVRVSIAAEEEAILQAFTDRRPEGWTVEGMSFSFTGLCALCREGRRD